MNFSKKIWTNNDVLQKNLLKYNFWKKKSFKYINYIKLIIKDLFKNLLSLTYMLVWSHLITRCIYLKIIHIIWCLLSRDIRWVFFIYIVKNNINIYKKLNYLQELKFSSQILRVSLLIYIFFSFEYQNPLKKKK